MILNNRKDLFTFNLPKGFIPDEITSKYYDYLKRIDSPFDSILDFVNFSILGVNFPGLNAEVVVQTLPGFDDEKRGRVLKYRSSVSKEDILDSKTLNVRFYLTDGCINYWILFETFWYYYNYDNKSHYTIDLPLYFHDSDGIVVCKVLFKNCIINKISNLELSFDSPSTEIQEFSLEIEYVELKVDINIDNLGNKNK